MKQRTLFVPVCNRTNYSKLKPILSCLEGNVKIVASSSLLLAEYAMPVEDIAKDGFDIPYRADCLLMNDSLESMCKTVGLSIIEHSSIFCKEDAAAVLVTGDRFDMLAPVMVARMMNIPILHIQGGERSGSVDDVVRDIISVAATRHYVATEKARERVQTITGSKLVFNFGCPAVEYISSVNVGPSFDVTTLHKRFKHSIPIQPNEPYLLVMAHPNTTDEHDIDMEILLDAVLSFQMKAIILYPNVDPFSKRMSAAIREANHRESRVTMIKHAPLEDFVKMMAHCACMIGNSSAGIREAASFGVPVVNVGQRQKGRDRNKNTLDVVCNYDDLTRAISAQLKVGRYPKENIYFQTGSAGLIARDIESFLRGLPA